MNDTNRDENKANTSTPDAQSINHSPLSSASASRRRYVLRGPVRGKCGSRPRTLAVTRPAGGSDTSRARSGTHDGFPHLTQPCERADFAPRPSSGTARVGVSLVPKGFEITDRPARMHLTDVPTKSCTVLYSADRSLRDTRPAHT